MVFQRCCCCFSLQGGTVCLGWWHALVQLISAISTIVTLVFIDEVIRDLFPNEPTDQINSLITYYTWSLSISAAFNIILIVFALLLVIGASRNNRLLLMPWLITNFISITLSTVIVITLSIVTDTWFGLFFFIGIGIQLYLWLCVLSLYRQLSRQFPSTV